MIVTGSPGRHGRPGRREVEAREAVDLVQRAHVRRRPVDAHHVLEGRGTRGAARHLRGERLLGDDSTRAAVSSST